MKKERKTLLWICLLFPLVGILCTWAIDNPDFRPTALMRASAYNNRAWERAANATTLEQYTQALADCNKAVSCDSELVNSYDTRAYIYAKLGKNQNAVADIKQAVAKDADKVLKDWNDAITEYPKDAYSYALRGLVYLELRDNKNANSDLDKAIQLDPSCRVSWIKNRGMQEWK